MSKTYTEFGNMDEADIIYATTNDKNRVRIPEKFKGYEETENDKESPNWLPVVKSIVGDSLIDGELGDLTSEIEEASINKEKAIKRVQSGIDHPLIDNEENAEALIDYLASDVDPSSESNEGKHFEVTEDGIKLFSDDVNSMAKNQDASGIYNVEAILSASIDALDDYLQRADDIADTMEELTEEINTERLYNAEERIEEIETELKKLGEGSGYTDYDDLSTTEQQRADHLGETLELYEYMKETNHDFADNITNIDYDQYHEDLKNLKTFLKESKADMRNAADKTRLAESSHDVPEEVISNATEGIKAVRNEYKNMISIEGTAEEYESKGAEVLAAKKGGEISEDHDAEIGNEDFDRTIDQDVA